MVNIAALRKGVEAREAGADGTRRDIQALRAIAVGAVVLGHLWPHKLVGGRVGVDVFFVISGFLITSHLLRKPPVDRHTLLAFWARRIRRLLPAATLVLAFTMLGAWLLMPAQLTHRVGVEAAAASVYGENWARWVAETTPALKAIGETPVQHYWSLSVEEQFYFLWPLFIGAVVILARRNSQTARANLVNHWLLVAIGTVVGISFLLSVWTTRTHDALGYFGTHVRMWELAIGGLVGLAYHAGWRLNHANPWLRVGMAWFGFLLIMASAYKFGSFAYPFPGPFALLPVVGTALVIAAETDDLPLGFGKILGFRPIQYIGDISYSAYLWHWPLIMLASFVVKHDPTNALRLVVGVLTLVLGALTREFVEEKLRYQRGIVGTIGRSYAMGAICIGIVLLLALATTLTH